MGIDGNDRRTFGGKRSASSLKNTEPWPWLIMLVRR